MGMRENKKVPKSGAKPTCIGFETDWWDWLKNEGLLEEFLSVKEESEDDLENQGCSYPLILEDENDFELPDFLK